MQDVFSVYGRRSISFPRRTVAYVVLAGLLGVVGCGPKPDPAASKGLPYQGLTIRVVVPKGWGFKEFWDLQREEWSAQSGAKAEVVEADMSDGSGPLLKPSDLPQLIIFPWTRRGELLAEKQLQALPSEALTESQLDWNDLFQGLREKQGQSELGPTLMPLGSPVLVCYYRADLLEKAGLKPPETWADYQSLLDQMGTWAPGLKAVEPWSPEFRATMFLARALPYVKHSGHYSTFFDVEQGKPLIDSPGFVKALEDVQAAIKKLPPEVLKYDPVACRNLVIAGEAALAIGLETGPIAAPLSCGAAVPVAANQAQAQGKPPQRPDSMSIGFCRLPGAAEVYNPTLSTWVTEEQAAINRVTLTGFAGLCAGVPQGTDPEQSKAALNLLSSLLLRSQVEFPTNSRSLCRETQTPEASLWVGKDLAGSESGKYIAVTANSLRDRQQVGELPVLGHLEFRTALTNGLTEALEKGKSPAESLAGIAQQWQEILKKLGPEKVLASYRSALGLSQLEKL